MSRNIRVSLIETNPNQPRKHFDQAKINQLAESMKESGLIIPIMVRPDLDRYIIVHGERRYRAALSLGWTHIAAEVKQVDHDNASWLALIENIQRQDLSPIEEALAYKEKLATGINQTELGKRIGKSQSYIAQKLRLLKLSDRITTYLNNGEITEGHAKQLLRLSGDLIHHRDFIAYGVNHLSMSVSKTTELVTLMLDMNNRYTALMNGIDECVSIDACEADIERADKLINYIYQVKQHQTERNLQ